MQAKISEIFLSYQGEGPYAGSRQLFVRFHGCNLSCIFCDTRLKGCKSLTKEALLSRALDFGPDYNELALTGGEPLLFCGFLEEFLPYFKSHEQKSIYLETNGTLPKELKRIIDHIDIVAMDFKLPSSTAGKAYWDDHEKFAKIASGKKLITKAVITSSTTMDDVKIMSSIIKNLEGEPVVVLQPVTPVETCSEETDEEMMWYFKKFLEKDSGKDVMILGQVHKCVGIK
jgi:organic radical activating enzyme